MAQDELCLEEWRDIAGYEGLYQISDKGRVRSLDRFRRSWTGAYTSRVRGKILKPALGNHGYLIVNLSKDNKRDPRLVHRLVAETFVPNPDNKPCVDHYDGNRLNNSANNLRWVTYTENNENISRLGHCVSDKTFSDETQEVNRRKTATPVIRDDGKYYGSAIEAARDLGYKTSSMVVKNIGGLVSHVRGHTFRHASIDEFMASDPVLVLQIDPDTGDIVNHYLSAMDAVRTLGNQGIASCLAGKEERAAGYAWTYGRLSDYS